MDRVDGSVDKYCGIGPLGAFLTYKSNKDSVVLNADAYMNWFRRIVGIRSVGIVQKEVIIDDPVI